MSLCSKPKLITFWCRYCNNSYFSNYCWILYIFFHLIIEAIFLHFYHSLVLQVFSMICFLQPSLAYYFEDFMIKCCLCVYQIISTSCISYTFTALFTRMLFKFIKLNEQVWFIFVPIWKKLLPIKNCSRKLAW